MTLRDFAVTTTKHVRRRGPNVAPTLNFDRATETHFLAIAYSTVDGHQFGIKVIALPAAETIPPSVIAALQGTAQSWVDQHPTDPGTPQLRGG